MTFGCIWHTVPLLKLKEAQSLSYQVTDQGKKWDVVVLGSLDRWS